MLRLLAATSLLALSLHHAAAQQPTQEQREAIRSACMADFLANCEGTEPGGREAFECLVRHETALHPACKTAVNAAMPKPAETAQPPAPTVAPPPPVAVQVAPAPPASDQLTAVQKACTLNDLVAHCSWIAPTNPEILLCLKANAADLSPSCQVAVQSLPAAAAPVPPPPAVAAPAPALAPPEPPRQAEPVKKPEPAHTAAPPSPPAPAAAAPRAPTEQQKAAIRAACRSDFMARCAGVQPGGAEALQCLKRNEAQLSAGCRSAVAAIGGGAAPAAGAPAAAGVPAVAPIGPLPTMRPRDALAILQVCRAEAGTLCAGVPMGGGRILNCLAQNASSLSPQCYGALSAAASR
jgi:hypothetical protein